MKVVFKKGFSLSGTWFEKDSVVEFNDKIASALIERKVVFEDVQKKVALKPKTNNKKG